MVCDSIPLISEAISFIGDPLAPQELCLTPRESLFALIQLSSAAIEFTDRACGDHRFT